MGRELKKVICCDISPTLTGSKPLLTLKKVYKVVDYDEIMYSLIADDGYEKTYRKDRFIDFPNLLY
jgi:hypothetical protein